MFNVNSLSLSFSLSCLPACSNLVVCSFTDWHIDSLYVYTHLFLPSFGLRLSECCSPLCIRYSATRLFTVMCFVLLNRILWLFVRSFVRFASLFDIVFLHFSLLLLFRFSYSFDSFIHYVCSPLFLLFYFMLFFSVFFRFVCCFFIYSSLLFLLLLLLLFFFVVVIVDVCYFFPLLFSSIRSSLLLFCYFFFHNFNFICFRVNMLCVFFLFFFSSLHHCHSMKLKIANIKRLCTTTHNRVQCFIRHHSVFQFFLSFSLALWIFVYNQNGKIREIKKKKQRLFHSK